MILWRHADAKPGSPDDERELTARGLAQATRVAAWLNRHLPDDAVVLASPARRAQQTARALNREMLTVADLGTASDAARLLKAAGWPDAGGHVVIVGHQPTLGEAVAWTLSGSRQGWALRKAALVWLQGSAGRSRAELYAAITPELA